MLKIINCSLLLLVPIFLFGQFSYENQDDKSQKLVNKYECFFRTMENQSRLFKVGFFSFSRRPGSINNDLQTVSGGLEIGIEQRLTTGLSIQLKSQVSSFVFYHRLDHPDFPEPVSDFSTISSISTSLEMKKYFGKKRQIKQGISGNNLSGFYIGILGGINNWNVYGSNTLLLLEEESVFDSRTTFNVQTKMLALTGGWQYQFGKNGFINFQLLTGRNWQDHELNLLRYEGDGQLQPLPAIQNWIFDYRLSFGWAFGKKKEYLPTDCSVIQYFEEEYSLWKFDLLGLLANVSDKAIAGSVSIEYEQKLGSSPFSINPFVTLPYTLAFDKESDGSVSFVVGSDFRYYYNLKKRIRKGKTGNNLFANYLGARLAYFPQVSDDLSYGYGLMWGLQRRLFKNIYVDYQVGFQTRSNFKSIPNTETTGESFGQLKIGLAF